MMDIERQIESLNLAESPLTWERIAATRYGRYLSRIELGMILRAHALAPRPTLALDVGCDGGRWSTLLAELGWQIVCTDTDPASLSVCQRRLPAARCVLASPEQTTLPCAPASVGLLLCIEVSPVVEAAWFLGEAHRVLQPGGLLVGVAWNRLSYRALAHRLRGARRRAGGDDWQWYQSSYAEWHARVRQAGFAIVAHEGFAWLPFGRASNCRLVEPAAQVERSLGLHRVLVLSPWIAFIARRGTMDGAAVVGREVSSANETISTAIHRRAPAARE